MKVKTLLFMSLILCLHSACSGVAPVAGLTSTTPTTSQFTESSVELVWSMTGDPNSFNIPDGIAVDQQGNLYVSDRSNGLSKFDSNRQFLAKWDNCGDDKPIRSATGVAVDSQDNLYVFDLSNLRVCKFDGHGRYLNQWDGSGSAEGPLTLGGGIAVDWQANVYVAEPFAGRIRKFRQR